MRDANPTVVLVLDIGMFSFGKNKTESAFHRRVLYQRITRHGGRKSRLSLGTTRPSAAGGPAGRPSFQLL